MHKMTDEQRAGYALALQSGARSTAAIIRANKATVGSALVSACREIGTRRVVEILVRTRKSEYALCAIRYAPGITQAQRESLAAILSQNDIARAQWVLATFLHLSKSEISVLRWVAGLPNTTTA